MGLVWIVGFTCTGKSTIGKLLAKKLNMSFVDTDSYMEQKTGHSILQLFDLYGESYFRNLESFVIQEIITSQKNCIIATGGGVFTNKEVQKKIKQSGKVIHLLTAFEIVNARLKDEKELKARPKFKNYSELELKKLYDERLAAYKKADIQIECTNKTKNEIIDEIQKKL